MAWSTRQLAELADTSVRTVRHYHDVGLLAQPERRANGYKSYGVAHLTRLLWIRRLTDLGFTLSQISAWGDVDAPPEEALRSADAEAAEAVERLQQVRIELARLLCHEAPADLPPEMAPVAFNPYVSDTDLALASVMSRVLSPSVLHAVREVIRTKRADPVAEEFNQLADDADERTRAELADRVLTRVRGLHSAYPALASWGSDGPVRVASARETVDAAIEDLLNSAQNDVLHRVRQRYRSEQLATAPTAPAPSDTPTSARETP
ncbi:MerR family transcriptional regulator [Streptomyces sp. Inha503]|uniref:helix-turn-helix domain-containing protein n=1 Tax=Streptomyces sp. Inha503 TaxID=3383314 RepID=UPI0039A1A9DF